MKLPVSFAEFQKNPVAAVAFCMLLVVGYLYVDLRSGYTEQIEKAKAGLRDTPLGKALLRGPLKILERVHAPEQRNDLPGHNAN